MAEASETLRQPWLHDLDVTVLGTVTCVAGGDGDLGDQTVSGLYVDDRRVLSRAVLRYDERRAVRLTSQAGGSTSRAYLVARELGPGGPDPTVTVRRSRDLVGLGMSERLVVASSAPHPVTTTLTIELAGDGLDMARVKAGHGPGTPLPCLLGHEGDDSAAAWEDELHRTVVRAPDAKVETLPEGGVRLAWDVTVPPAGEAEIGFEVTAHRRGSTSFDPSSGAHLVDWSAFAVRAEDRRLDLTVAASRDDLVGLLQTDPDDHDDAYFGAGSPWYLTLFGRDSLWAARLALPLGTRVAGGTLRSLARRQGRRHDVTTAEEPGKIVHEVRRPDPDDRAGGHALPPVYYGTVDATALWVLLLHDAWRWGMPEAEVRTLLPALDAAVGWLRSSVAASPDGLVRYDDPTGEGLSNQGWKDSHDAMRRRDGSVAESPIALLEVQGYAVQAARAAAHLGEQLAEQDGEELRTWADAMSARVRERFWVSDDRGRYLAMALDRHGDPVDGVASNMGHVVGSGLLTDEEDALVAVRLAGPDLLGPFGIGTLSSDNPAYNPIGYHTGSVWVHDTAIAAAGLAAAGHDAEAARTLRALVDAAGAFGYRMPELFGADAALGRPAPYPASCRPQAWSAASAVAMATVALGLRPDVPGGRLRVRPLRPAPFGALVVEGIRLGDATVHIETDDAGELVDVRAPEWLEVTTD